MYLIIGILAKCQSGGLLGEQHLSDLPQIHSWIVVNFNWAVLAHSGPWG